MGKFACVTPPRADAVPGCRLTTSPRPSRPHGALGYLLGINALRASEAAAVRIEDFAGNLRGHRVPHLMGKGNKPATMPLTVPLLRLLEACRGQRAGRLVVDVLGVGLE